MTHRGSLRLRLRRHDDTVVVFSMLKIVFRHDRVTRGRSISCKQHVFFRDLRGGAAYLHVGSARLEVSGERILRLSVIRVAGVAVIIVVIIIIVAIAAPAPAAPVLLSLPHGLPSIVIVGKRERRTKSKAGALPVHLWAFDQFPNWCIPPGFRKLSTSLRRTVSVLAERTTNSLKEDFHIAIAHRRL